MIGGIIFDFLLLIICDFEVTVSSFISLLNVV
jgi:hypothetical protein